MEAILIATGVLAVFVFGAFALFAKFYNKVQQGHVLIVNTLKSVPEVTFTGRMVFPIIHIKELMEISLKTIVIDRSGKEGLICRDNIRADIKVTFFIRVNKTTEDVLKVAQAVGCGRASDQDTLEELFSAKFSEALKTVGKSMDFVDLYQARDRFRDEIIRQIGDDLSGYVLDDAAIDYLEQTPIEKLDPNNILDAQGIRKITELTAMEHVQTNELQRNEQMQIKKKDVQTTEALLELARQQADAEARQQREIASVQAREQAEAAKVQAEEKLKSETARIKMEQDVAIQNENMKREMEVAENNRKRAVAIEEEKVVRARDLEVVAREREVTLQEIEKEKAVEIEKKNIAEVIRERIAVERTVAEQEEAINELRVVSEADRNKKASVITAEGRATEKMVMDVKEAEAEEIRAKHKAAEQFTLAEAKLKVAEKDAESKKREAEGIEALSAASGLAEAKVMAVQADAKEKDGMAEIRVKLADADAVAKLGRAEASALKDKLEAEASGKEKLGLADVNVRLADADALRLRGEAEATAIQARFVAEAAGLKEKFAAMDVMTGDTRAHEEFRMRLDNAHTETLKAIDANTLIAKDQAEVLSVALRNAKIDIVGGDGDYFQRFVNALGIGKAIDATIGKSDTLQTVFKGHLNGEKDFITDVKDVLGNVGTDDLQNLTVSAFLAKVMSEGSDEQKALIGQLMGKFGRK
ncbi:hypothetical protein ACUHMQ_01580 [Chitinimonas sp. PSY-7]|uniref:hypothetical protein n=1 Tax=Chitinimonas sp. PSY-7 TaxID=3459088 RepID=UPI00403FEF9F